MVVLVCAIALAQAGVVRAQALPHELGPAQAAAGPAQEIATATATAPASDDLRSRYRAVDGGISQPLSDQAGNADRGRRIVTDRQVGLCTMCHSGPFSEVRFQGNISTNLAGAGERWTAAQLRLRLVDPQRLNPDSIMPGYFRNHGLQQVGKAWQGQPILTAQQIEDVVAFLVTLK